MTSLFGIMSISAKGLLAEQSALQVTSNNIANLNTEGYTRKRVALTEDVISFGAGHNSENGVHVESIQSLRNRVTELSINGESQQQSSLQNYVNSMEKLDSLFSDLDNGIGARIDKFFNNIAALANNPADLSNRQAVLVSANNLASSFRNTVQSVRDMQISLDAGIVQSVETVNELATQIASLNGEVSRAMKFSGDGGGFQDRQTELIRKLSQQIDVSVIQSNDGITLTTQSGALLVAGDKSFDLSTVVGGNGFRDVYSGGVDLTKSLSGGAIAGLLRARDGSASRVIDDLNSLASDLAAGVNSANKEGIDLGGQPGVDVFSEPIEDAASNIYVVIADSSKIAASSDGSPGDTGNLGSFVSVASSGTVKGQTPVDFYAGIVSSIGNSIATAKAELDASDMAMQQLNTQWGAISGVSLDEEAADLVRFQRAFEASARVISVVDEMLQTLLALGR